MDIKKLALGFCWLGGVALGLAIWSEELLQGIIAVVIISLGLVLNYKWVKV